MSQAVNPDYMREALALARRGRALASPNPMVGAVVVNGGEVVGRGFHTWETRDHAEVVALAEAGDKARGATVYVNLEPCSHYGRTPPCPARRSESAGARRRLSQAARRRYRSRNGAGICRRSRQAQ
jgi:diaminohydroxyphosphoribosylaminopyrimidine deaminase/5-amino-6-(5-phosphoribosylamino)uracil reductase